jgi:SAM-dependent methyltransferase
MTHPDHEKNRAMWNEIVDIHYRHPDYRVAEFLTGQSTLKQLDKAELGDVRGKTLLHLMCQFGLDTLSWAREGAIVTGVDISDRSIEQANKLKSAAGLEGRFVRSDVLELRSQLTESFDIVYQSYGTLCWLGDIAGWAGVVKECLNPGGTFLLIDDHPVHFLFQEPGLSYFSRKAEYYANIPDYCDRTYIRRNVSAEWIHPVSEILNALIQAGLTITRFEEFNFGYYPEEATWYQDGERWYPATGPSAHPLMMLVRASRT